MFANLHTQSSLQKKDPLSSPLIQLLSLSTVTQQWRFQLEEQPDRC